MPLPSGGVFAEAVLGRFNSAEKLDITRFWNWQDSPIPIVAPEIAAIQAGSRAQPENVEPGQLSSPVVNIMDAAELPAPQGFAAILSAMGNGNMFRDMSNSAATIALTQAALQGAFGAASDASRQAGANFATAAGLVGSLNRAPSTSSTEGAKINHGIDMDRRGVGGGGGGGPTPGG